MKTYIRRVTDGEDLTQTAAREAAAAVFENATEAQDGALLAGLRFALRPEVGEERADLRFG